jgi:serine/threonine protein kinase
MSQAPRAAPFPAISSRALPPTVERARRRRRPSGAPPPLPRALGSTGKAWLAVAAAALIWCVLYLQVSAIRRVSEQADSAVLRVIARFRAGWLTDLARGIDRLGSGWTTTFVAIGTLIALMVLRRWRHLFTFLGVIVVLEFLGGVLYDVFSRPRPYDVTIIGRWAGFAMPSPPVAVLIAMLVGVAYTLIVPGRPRTTAKVVISVVIVVFAAARLYLAVDHPTDILVGGALTMAIAVNAFRFFTPNEVFPVAYRKGKTAHLDVGGQRGEAILAALRDQLGLNVTEVKPIGLEGSGGSTPLRLRVAGDPDTYLFGKLYAMSHVRADRWYKLGRTILYGRLEDEAPYQSVRRLIEYEDYTLRLLHDVGLPTPVSYGIVEMTPSREYLLVMEFFDGAQEITEADVDVGVIDEGLAIVRRLWDAGLAHRDIKPANLMVRDGHVLLIDVAFAQVRPSPWRQAVDLANMMLVLAIRSNTELVYDRARLLFTPDEIAEAFAAARGVASPSQLKSLLKRDGRDLVAQFRALAPERRPISLQRWSFRRVFLAAGLVLAVMIAFSALRDLLRPAHDEPISGTPTCGTSDMMILIAQSVPTATSVPCIESFRAGWAPGGVRIGRDRTVFWLDSDIAGERAVEVTLQRQGDCHVRGVPAVPSDQVAIRRYERVEQLPPQFRSTRYYVLPGGCVTYRFAFDAGSSAELLVDADTMLGFQPRRALIDEVADQTGGLRLCGAGATCPGGR